LELETRRGQAPDSRDTASIRLETEPMATAARPVDTGDIASQRSHSAPAGVSEWLRTHTRCLLSLVGLTVALYLPTLGYDFVNWDDPWYVVNNPLIKSWQPSNLYALATQAAVRNYAPATLFSFLVDHTLWGLWAGGFHLTNLLLHALNAALVYALVVRLTHSRWTAWATAALFAVHPVQIETVAWISSRKGLLSATFILAALMCWLRPKRSGRAEAWGLAFFALALLSKAIAVVVPAVVLLYDVLVRRETLAVALPRQVIPGFLSVLLLLATMSAQSGSTGGVREHLTLSQAEILAVDAVILWRYAGMLAWPADLCVLYDPPAKGIALPAAVGGTAWLAVAVLLWRSRKRRPMPTWAAATCLLFLLPVLNLFPITTLMNDRYLYLPSVAAFGLFAAALHRLPAVWKASGLESRCAFRGGVPRNLTVAAMLICYGMMAHAHLPVWRDGLSLWGHAAAEAPRLAAARIELANALHAAGRDDAAVRVLHGALRDCPADELDRARIERKLGEWAGPR
ncbi:MAG: hypothetical protein ACREJB_06630, partial [Planctomycetaceae bacterium]